MGYARAMPAPAILADNLCDLVRELTRPRQGGGPHWLAVSDLHAAMRRHGLDLADDDLQAAIAICVERCVLKTAGDPPHSVAPWQRDWDIGRR